MLQTTVAFQAFPCHDFGADGRWLKVDASVQCGSTEHASVVRWAWAAVAVYPIGLLIATGWLLGSERASIIEETPTALAKALAFLYQDSI